MKVIRIALVLVSAVLVSACTTTVTSPDSETTYTQSEVEQHNTQSDCWMVIGTSVYDVTQYIELHPAGAGSISSGCGKDATGQYDGTRDGAGHLETTDRLLEEYKIGNLQN